MSKTCELLAIGTELLLGNICNTDAQFLSQRLSELGINVFFHTVVGDNPERISKAVEIARGRSDIIITTGGLGPTFDDLTKETVAACFEKKLILHEKTVLRIEEYFKKLGRVPTPNNLRQAMLPEGCTVLDNGCGTAPGCAFEACGKHVIMLPGPPRECEAMFISSVLPYLSKLSDANIFSQSIRIFGMGEAEVEFRLSGMISNMQNPTVAPYAKDGEVMLRVTAKAASADDARALTDPVVQAICASLGDVVYGVDTDSLEQSVSALLRSRGMTLATAESCTGGLISARMTELPGASDVFSGGVCTYRDEAKTALLGISPETISRFGVVSEEVARGMARAVREKLGASIGLGVTGYAGPGGDGNGERVGSVHIALDAGDFAAHRELKLGLDRSRIRRTSSSHALDMVRRYLSGLS